MELAAQAVPQSFTKGPGCLQAASATAALSGDPPLSLKGTAISIRKFSEKPITLDMMRGFGSMSEKMATLRTPLTQPEHKQSCKQL
jgi:type IV secretory pathway ATPase VirB11/archaellum biosynthesis ATPase